MNRPNCAMTTCAPRTNSNVPNTATRRRTASKEPNYVMARQIVQEMKMKSIARSSQSAIRRAPAPIKRAALRITPTASTATAWATGGYASNRTAVWTKSSATIRASVLWTRSWRTTTPTVGQDASARAATRVLVASSV